MEVTARRFELTEDSYRTGICLNVGASIVVDINQTVIGQTRWSD